MNQIIGEIRREVGKVILGKDDAIAKVLMAMLSGGHVLLEDVPGTGKTTLAAAISRAAGLKFNRAQFTPDIMASDITGFNIYNRASEKFEFRNGLVMCNILLADEINRASPKTQSALLEAMEEGAVTVDGVTYEMPKPFMVVATQNPTGYIGTYPLPEAQLDRFVLRLSLGYPSETEEISVILQRKLDNPLESVKAVTDAQSLMTLRQIVSKVNVAPEISRYIVQLVAATRNTPLITLGASPRASLALMRLSQAYAFIRGRDYVLAEDVSALYVPVVAHRLALSQEARMQKKSTSDILGELSRGIEVPYKTARTTGR